MNCGILSAAGACLLVVIPLAADDKPARAGKATPVELGWQADSSPLPTQIWWTDRPGDFLVYESGPGRLAEIDSWKRQINRIFPRAHNGQLRDCAVPAPNGDWSVKIDHRLPEIWFTPGDLRQLGNANVAELRGRLPNFPYIAVGANPQ